MNPVYAWWLRARGKANDVFMPIMTVIAIITGGILLFSGIHVLKQAMMVHVLELVFTFSINALLLFGITRSPLEYEIKSILPLPVLLSTLAFSIFVVCLRVIPNYSPTTPWFVTPEVALIQGTWMNTTWIVISVLGSFLVLILSFWITSKARFGDFIWPIITFFITSIVFNAIANFFLFLANYSTKIVGQ